jgi:hypothetical protein
MEKQWRNLNIIKVDKEYSIKNINIVSNAGNGTFAQNRKW